MKDNTVQQNISSGWIIKKMDDFIKDGSITLGRGEVISKTDIKNYPGENPIYSSSVKNNALFGKYAKYMFDEELITWSVDGGGDFFYRPKHKFSVTNVSGYLNADQKQFDYKFLAYYLQEEHSKKSFDYQNKAHPSVIRELYVIAKPPIKEQQRIAEILGTVDEDIAKTQEVIEATEKLKRGLMQQLFTRGIGYTKFKETKIGQIPEEWDVGKVGDLFKSVIGGGTPSRKETKYWNGDIPWMTVKDMSNKKYVHDTEEYITEAGLKESSSSLIPENNLITSTRMGIGRVYINKVPVAINQDLKGLIPKDDFILDYTYWLILSVAKQLEAKGTGSTVKGIRLEDFKSLEIALTTNKTEQKEISEILSAVDEKISVNKKLKEKLTLLKKGLMQDLLSGKVRTIIN